MSRPTFRFAFAGEIIDSVIHPVVLPLVDGEPTWTVHETTLDSPRFAPWHVELAARATETNGWAALRPEGLLLRFPNHANFLIDIDGRNVWAAPDPEFTEFAAHLLIDHVAPRRFALLGEKVLHATCVALPSSAGPRAIGLFGATGAGKSTFATYAVRRGARFVADDCLLLRPTTDGGPTRYSAVPSYAGARLWGDSLAAIGGAIAEQSTVSSWGKGRLDLEARFDPARVPIEAVVKLVRSTAQTPGTSPSEAATPGAVLQLLTPSEAAVTLVGTFFLNEKGGLSAPDLLSRSSELARDLPVYRLTYPSGYERLEDAFQLLTAHFGLIAPVEGQGS